MKEQCQVLSSVKDQWAAEREEMKYKFDQTRTVIMDLRRIVEDKEAKLMDLEGQLAQRSDEVGVSMLRKKVGKLPIIIAVLHFLFQYFNHSSKGHLASHHGGNTLLRSFCIWGKTFLRLVFTFTLLGMERTMRLLISYLLLF